MARVNPLVLIISLALPPSAWAAEVVLVYQKQNQWVAPADAASLRQVYAAAKRGTTQFTVTLPRSNRALSEQRLTVLLGLLEKQAGAAVTLTEANGNAAPNTLRVGW
jgi:hypothetical protein